VQDGENGDEHQNFKYINWVDIEKVSGNWKSLFFFCFSL
jgi:hypothetical protein